MSIIHIEFKSANLSTRVIKMRKSNGVLNNVKGFIVTFNFLDMSLKYIVSHNDDFANQ